MKKLILIVIIAISGCSSITPEYEKPYVIISKDIDCYANLNEACYTYQSSNGETNHFTDYNDKYSIGDTIK